MEHARMDAVVEKQDTETQLVVNLLRDGEKHDRAVVRTIAFGILIIGWGAAYWLWPSTLDSPGAGVYVIWSGLIAIGATALGIVLWEIPSRQLTRAPES